MFFETLQKRGVRVVDGNSVVRDFVASGQWIFGLTDTDDACGAKQKGAPVAIVFPDQAEKEMGTVLIPNTAALIAKAPHPLEAQNLLDFLLSKEVEQQLVESGWCHIPLRQLETRPTCFETDKVKAMK